MKSVICTRCLAGWRSQREDQTMLPCAAAFGCKREQANMAFITHYRPGWRSQRDDQTMPSSEAAFRRKRRQWRESDFAEGKKVLPECRRAWEQGNETL